MSKHLERLAERLKDDPFFLAAAITAYKRSAQVDDRALAAKLGCSNETLVRLSLCRMPASGAGEFWREIQQIASHFSVDPDELAEVVRHGQSVVRLQPSHEAKAEEVGFLIAARDDDTGEAPTT